MSRSMKSSCNIALTPPPPWAELGHVCDTNELRENCGLWCWYRTSGQFTGQPVSPVFDLYTRAYAFPRYNELLTPLERARRGDTHTPIVDWGDDPVPTGATVPFRELAKMWEGSPTVALRAITRMVADALKGTTYLVDLHEPELAVKGSALCRTSDKVAIRARRHDYPTLP